LAEKDSKNKIITYDDVMAAVESLKIEGRHPSLRAVRDFIGRGSISTIQPILKQIMDSFRSVSLEYEDKMRPIISKIADFTKTSVLEATNGLKNDILNIQKDLDDTSKELSICEAAKSELEADNIKLMTEVTALNAKLGSMEKSWEETKKELILARKENESIRQEQAKLKFREEDWLEAKTELIKVKEQAALELGEAKAKAAWLQGKLEAFEKGGKKERTKSEVPSKTASTKVNT
jgi:chromosome condensin MukBEF ATPase and DNA-binding subunit MukB